MGNELGTQNASATKEEENEAIKGKENIRPAEDGSNGENYIIPQGESKDFHLIADLTASLSPDGPDLHESVETGKDEDEPHNLDKVVGHTKEDELAGEDDHTAQKAEQGDEDNSKKCLQNGCIRTDDDDIEVQEKKPSLYVKEKDEEEPQDLDKVLTHMKEDELEGQGDNTVQKAEQGNEDNSETCLQNGRVKFQENPSLSEKDDEFEAYESTNISTQESEGETVLSPREGEGIQEMSSTEKTEETGPLIDTGHHVNDLLEDEDFYGKQKGDDSEQETIFTRNDQEKYAGSINDISSTNGEFPPQIKLTDSSESTLENEKPVVPIDHTKLANCEQAFAEKTHEIDEIGEMAYSVPITEPSQAENEGEKEVRNNSEEATNGAFETDNAAVEDRIPEEQIHEEENIMISKIPSESNITPEMPGNGEINYFESSISDGPEMDGRFSIQSNPEQPCNRIELRKCPSFDFGVPLDTRSEESDQTPFLQPPKSPFRSLSTSSKTANGRYSVDYESNVVGEKTIRVERSDSFHSTAPLRSIRKEETENAEVLKVGDEPGRTMKVELESSSSRKTRSSFFTTCLCCSAAIN